VGAATEVASATFRPLDPRLRGPLVFPGRGPKPPVRADLPVPPEGGVGPYRELPPGGALWGLPQQRSES